MTANPHICFVAGTLGQGGAERQLYYCLRTLRSMEYPASVITLGRGEFWEEPIRELGIPIYYGGDRKGISARLMALRAIVRKVRPDILQAMHYYVNPYAAVVARCTGCREIGAIRSNGHMDYQEGGKFARPALKWPRVVAANSREGMENAVALGARRERLFFLPNALDTDMFAPAENRSGNETVILCVGRLVPQKRFDRFIRLIAEAKKQTAKPFRAQIIGDGSLREELERTAYSVCGLVPHTLQFIGSVRETLPYYQKADILALTSDLEGTPNVLLEAMACGLPAVCTNTGETARIIQNGVNGYVSERDDENGLLKNLLRLIGDPEHRRTLGKKARETIERNYSLKALPEYLRALYASALQ